MDGLEGRVGVSTDHKHVGTEDVEHVSGGFIPGGVQRKNLNALDLGGQPLTI